MRVFEAESAAHPWLRADRFHPVGEAWDETEVFAHMLLADPSDRGITRPVVIVDPKMPLVPVMCRNFMRQRKPVPVLPTRDGGLGSRRFGDGVAGDTDGTLRVVAIAIP